MIIIPRPDVLSRRWNPQPDRSITPLIDRIQWANQRFECEVELRGIAILDGSGGMYDWSYIRAVVGPKGSKTTARQSLSYPDVRFEHEFITVASFLERFEELRENEAQNQYTGSFEIGGFTARLRSTQTGWENLSKTSDDRMCSSPHWVAERAIRAPSSRSDILVSSEPGHPLYRGVSDLREDMGGYAVYQLNDSRLHSFVIFVVDQRSWFRSLLATDEGVQVSIGGLELSETIIQARINGHAWSARAAGVVLLPPFEPPARVQMALVEPKDDLIDWKVWDVYPAADTSELRELIIGGENELVEFKPWVSLGDSKLGEIVDTVIAMANGDVPGTIIIGIDDYGQSATWKIMKDYEAAARTEGNAFSDQLSMRTAAAECYAVKLLDRIRERISPFPPIKRDVLEYGEGVVLRLQVAPGPLMVMREGLHHVLVRRGASNRHAPREVLDKLVHRGR